MNREQLRELMSPLLDGELPAAEAEAALTQIHADPLLAEEYALIQMVSRELKVLAPEPPQSQKEALMAKLFSEKSSARKFEVGGIQPANVTKPGFLSFLQRNPSMAAAGTLGLLAAGVLVVLNVGQSPTDSTTAKLGVDESDTRQNLTASAKDSEQANPIKEALEKKPEQDSAALLEQIFKKSTQGGAQQQQPASTNAAGGEKLLELLRQSAKNKSAQQAPAGPVGLKGSLVVYLDGPGSSKAKSETSTNEAALKLFQSAGIVEGGEDDTESARAAAPNEEAPAAPPVDSAAGEGKLPEPVSIAVRSMPVDSTMQVVSPQLLTRDIVPGVDMVRMAQGGFGKVLLKVSVDASGQVTAVEEGLETRVSAEGRRQLDTLKAAISGWKFRPSRVGANEVAFTLDLHMPPAQ